MMKRFLHVGQCPKQDTTNLELFRQSLIQGAQQNVDGCHPASPDLYDLGICGDWGLVDVQPSMFSHSANLSHIMPKAAGIVGMATKDGALERLDAHQAGFIGLSSCRFSLEALADSADWAELVEPVSNSEIFVSGICQLHSFIPQSQNYELYL